MAGILDYFQNTMQSPLFLSGASLLTGGGMGGAIQGMQAGLQFQDHARRRATEDEQNKAYQGLLADPNIPQQILPVLRASQPSEGLKLAADYLSQDHGLEAEYKRAQINALNRKSADDASEYGKTGSVFLNPETGRYEAVQFSNRGTLKRTPLDALTPSKGVQQVGDVLIDRATGKPISNVGSNLAAGEAAKAVGETQGKQIAAAPADVQAADTSLDLIDKIRKSPARERGTGTSAIFNYVPYTSGYDFENLVQQAKSGAFLSAIQQMRGMGSLSNAEGQTATAAVNRMNTATTEEGFLDALNDYEKIVRSGRDRAASRVGQFNQITGTQQPAPTAGVTAGTYVFNPATGKLEPK